jgi:hypothetical protein
MGVKFLLFSQTTEGVDKPSKQVFRVFYVEAGGREDLRPQNQPLRGGEKQKQNKSKAKPPKRERKSRDQSLMKREKRAKPYARTKKSTS